MSQEAMEVKQQLTDKGITLITGAQSICNVDLYDEWPPSEELVKT